MTVAATAAPINGPTAEEDVGLTRDREDRVILRTEGLRKTYPAGWFRSRPIEALRGVSIEAYRGEVFGLLGPNGAGKTTLIKTLLGIIRASGGTGTLLDHPIGSRASRSRVGYLPESLRIDRHHTARSALAFYGRLSGLDAAAIRGRTDELLSLVGLAGRDREPVRRFSKGMYQRLGLAQALLHDPDLLILDEPTDGLDPVGRNEVRGVIEELRRRGKTIFLNSHILQEVEMVCSRVAVLARGTVRGIGSVAELVGPEDRLELSVANGLFDDDGVAAVLGPFGDRLHDVSPGANGLTRVTLAPVADDSIDAVIDRVRSAGWSIRELRRPRRTLEDVFIELVNRPDDDVDAGGTVRSDTALEAGRR